MKSFSERLHHVIPGGAHTYSRGDDQFPAIAPQILERGLGAYVWDPEGKQYLDYGMALRSITLGYANERVNKAAFNAIERGVNLTRASTIELAAAELLVDLIPSIDMVKFGKNGSNVTTAAVKIARAYTGRRYVCVPRQHPFFSFDDWFIGTTAVKRGVLSDQVITTLLFDYGDIASLQRLFEKHPGEIAAVMLEAATTVSPCSTACPQPLDQEPPCSTCPQRQGNFLHQVQALARSEGALFILDEMITGFRWHLQGAQTYFGLDPDLSTFGKGMANGFSVAAVGGKRQYMEVGATNIPGMERTFLLSTTHGGEMPGLAAFIETVKVYQEENVVEHLWSYGKKLKDGLTKLASAHGLEHHFRVDGFPISMNYVTTDQEGKPSMPLRTLFAQELIKHGVMMPWVAVSLAHGEAELIKTMNAADQALQTLKQAVNGNIGDHLRGPAVQPVFRPRN